MTLLTVVSRAARQCGLAPPTVAYGSTDETWLQFVEWAQETVDDLCLRHDWRALHELQTLTGDGTTVAFNLASDFSRLSKMPAVSRDSSSAGFWPAGPMSPPGFIGASSLPVMGVGPLFQIEAGVLTFVSAPADDETFTVSYQTTKPIVSSGTPVIEFLLDADTMLIPERLVRLGLVWRWKASKGLRYAEFLDSFERAFETMASHDNGLMAIELSGEQSGDEFGDVEVTV